MDDFTFLLLYLSKYVADGDERYWFIEAYNRLGLLNRKRIILHVERGISPNELKAKVEKYLVEEALKKLVER